MAEDSRIEDKKRYNAPYLRAFDYLAGEKLMNQERFATYIKGKSSYISALRAGTKRVGDDYIKRLAAAFVEHFNGKGHLNIDFILGKSKYMLVENVPDEEIIENVSRGANPDYDVMQQRKERISSQSQIPPTDVASIWIENAVKAAVKFAEMEIATLKEQVADKNRELEEKRKELANRDKTIKLLEQKIEVLEAMQHIDADNPLHSPFPVGVADKNEKITTRV